MHARTFLLFLTGLLMLAPSAVACRIPWIEPVPPHPHPQVSVRPALQPLVTQRHVAEIEIAEGIANIAISVRFHNPNHQQVEGTYFLPIEADAVVRDFEMIMDGKSLTRLSPFDSFMSYIWKISGECRRFSQAPLPARCRKVSL